MITIRGERVTSLESFYAEIGEAVNGPGGYFGANLDALNDCLRGGFGVEPPFTILWEHSGASRTALGYAETVRQLEARVARCHPTNRGSVREEIERAKLRQGATVFDWLTGVLSGADRVELLLL